ncbi:MAG: GFA family protein [Deltaproteobacteria bacterium]
MIIDGSCHCNKVKFSLKSLTPYPYICCYCSICRKTAGGGGYSINIMGEARTLEVTGKNNLKIYKAEIPASDEPGQTKTSTVERNFCKHCGSFLWFYEPAWPDWIYPFASAIDSSLPKPPERLHIFLDSAAPWCEIREDKKNRKFPAYPDESIMDWHKRHKLMEKM